MVCKNLVWLSKKFAILFILTQSSGFNIPVNNYPRRKLSNNNQDYNILLTTHKKQKYQLQSHADKEITISDTFSEQITSQTSLNPEISSKFKILTCSSTTCDRVSKKFGLIEYEILAGLYSRKEGAGAHQVTVEESPCLGCCKFAPCVAIEHDDYVGTVALDGMTPNEFRDRVFHNIVTEEDMDRVWNCVEDSIRTYEETDDDEEEEEEEGE